MSNLTKRILELFSLFVLLFYAYITWSEHRIYQNDFFRLSEAKKAFYTAVYRHYGPGQVSTYQNSLLNLPQYDKELLVASNRVANDINPGEGASAVSQAPDWFLQLLDKIEPILDSIHEALKNVTFLPHPDEIEAGMFGENIDYLHYSEACKAFRTSALQEWSSGHYEKALQRMMDIHRFGQAFKASPLLISHLISFSNHAVGFSGWENIVLTNPSPEWNRKILDSLSSLKPEEWHFPPYLSGTLVNYLLQSPEQDPEYIWTNQMSYAYILYISSIHNGDPSLNDLLYEHNIFPQSFNKLNVIELQYQIVEKLDKWSTLPALRKRIRNLPDAFFNDSFFTPDEVKTFPVVHYLGGRYPQSLNKPRKDEKEQNIFPGWINNPRIRLENTVAEMETLIAAFWARVYRDENGKWPPPVAVPWAGMQSSPYRDNISLLDTLDPRPFVDWVTAHNRIGGLGIPKVLSPQSESPTAIPVHYPIHLEPLEDFKLNYLIPSEPNASGSVKVNYLKWRQWTEGLLKASSPAVQNYDWHESDRWKNQSSSEETSAPLDLETGFMNYLEVNIQSPRRTLWAVHPGPDGIMDSTSSKYGFSISHYNPSNGLTSRGDIIQLAGWE